MFEDLGAAPHYADPGDDVEFGDIFEADFLLDIFAREDTTLLGGGPLPATLAPKVGKWMNTQLGQEGIELFSASFPAKPEKRFALAHASYSTDTTRRAILISDSCLTATALAQGRQQRSVGGRLLFAPLTVVEEAKWQKLVQTEDFERFPLPKDERVGIAMVAELSNCFMVDARDVKTHVGSRLASLSRGLAEELEVHWNGYATRRGPRAYGRNTLKLASLLAGGGQPGEADENATDALAAALDLALVLESADLEDVSAAEAVVRFGEADPAEVTPPLVARIVEHLRELSELASAAADELSAF